MPVDAALLKILACPVCRKPVTPVQDDTGEWLECQECARQYPVRDDVPVMLVEESRSATR